MQQDIFGQLTRLDGPALGNWNATQRAFLSHGAATPGHLAGTLEAAPDFAAGHAVKGMFHLLLGRRELIASAAAAARDARAAVAATPREQALVNALELWLDGNIGGVLDCFERLLRHDPSDTLTLKLDHALRFVVGDAAGMRRAVEAALAAHGGDHPGRGYVMGCHAFALEETGAYARARVAGRMALELCPDDAWGLHAVAHVHDMTADAAGGLAWLDGRDAAWSHCNNFRYHVWWHKALMHLDLGQTDAALALYDRQIRSDRTDDYRDIANATSLLMRLELDGADVGGRWSELADLSAARTEDGCLVFADMHYMLALVGDSRGAAIDTLVARLHRDARAGRNRFQRAMARPGLSLMAGLRAFGEGRFGVAFLNLCRARATLQQAGGSHAQRDVFERLAIDSGIRAGFLDEAETLLEQRSAVRAGSEDGYAAARRALIARGRNAACSGRVPAE